jgi:opacity protein-like surface antigen
VRHLLLLLFPSLVIATSAQAQNLWLNLDAGVANYDGELQDHRYTFQQSHPAVGLGVGYEITPNINLSTEFLYTRISGSDEYSRNIGNVMRNLSFTTNILEWNVRGEYVLFDLEDRPWSPYAFLGLAVFHFNPYAQDSLGRKTYLRPLSTEGEGIPGTGVSNYSLTQLAIPFGLGVRLALSENIRVGLEWGLRKTFTGYLDDVSGYYVDFATLYNAKGQEAVNMAYREDQLPTHGGAAYPAAGKPRGRGKDDWYYITALRVSYRFGGAAYTTRKHLGCPKDPQ